MESVRYAIMAPHRRCGIVVALSAGVALTQIGIHDSAAQYSSFFDSRTSYSYNDRYSSYLIAFVRNSQVVLDSIERIKSSLGRVVNLLFCVVRVVRYRERGTRP